MVEYVRTMKMRTFVNVQRVTVVIIANIMERYVIEIPVNMGVLVSVAQMVILVIHVFVHLEQLETTAKKILGMNVLTVHVRMALNVLTV